MNVILPSLRLDGLGSESRVYLQDLQGGDLVFQHFLGLVEVGQHVLRLPAVDGAQLGQLPLLPLCQVLLSSPEEGDIKWASEEPRRRSRRRKEDE